MNEKTGQAPTDDARDAARYRELFAYDSYSDFVEATTKADLDAILDARIAARVKS